jgi:hypothetical protein
MTKKSFKEQCRFELYTGSRRVNAIYFDWKQGDINGKYYGGYKYRVTADVKKCNKTELFNAFYDWVIKKHEPATYIHYKYAETDQQRFKIPLGLND